jgi:dTMP kinase
MRQTRTWIEPDLTFLMDVNPELALARIRASDRFEHKDLSYHHKLREAFLSVSGQERFRIIDTSRDREAVYEGIIHEVKTFIADHKT